MIELLHALASGGSVDTLAGIAYQKDGKIVVRLLTGRQESKGEQTLVAMVNRIFLRTG